MKTCNHCKLSKSLSEFGKDSHSKDGINPKCKACCRDFQRARIEEKKAYDAQYRQDNSESLRARDRERYKKDPESARLYKLMLNFGLTAEDEKRMLEQQDHVCAVCKKPEWVVVRGKVKRLAVDHCHKTDKVRGLLCNNCNRALGLLLDSPAIVESLLKYIMAGGFTND